MRQALSEIAELRVPLDTPRAPGQVLHGATPGARPPRPCRAIAATFSPPAQAHWRRVWLLPPVLWLGRRAAAPPLPRAPRQYRPDVQVRLVPASLLRPGRVSVA